MAVETREKRKEDAFAEINDNYNVQCYKDRKIHCTVLLHQKNATYSRIVLTGCEVDRHFQ